MGTARLAGGGRSCGPVRRTHLGISMRSRRMSTIRAKTQGEFPTRPCGRRERGRVQGPDRPGSTTGGGFQHPRAQRAPSPRPSACARGDEPVKDDEHHRSHLGQVRAAHKAAHRPERRPVRSMPIRAATPRPDGRRGETSTKVRRSHLEISGLSRHMSAIGAKTQGEVTHRRCGRPVGTRPRRQEGGKATEGRRGACRTERNRPRSARSPRGAPARC